MQKPLLPFYTSYRLVQKTLGARMRAGFRKPALKKLINKQINKKLKKNPPFGMTPTQAMTDLFV